MQCFNSEKKKSLLISAYLIKFAMIMETPSRSGRFEPRTGCLNYRHWLIVEDLFLLFFLWKCDCITKCRLIIWFLKGQTYQVFCSGSTSQILLFHNSKDYGWMAPRSPMTTPKSLRTSTRCNAKVCLTQLPTRPQAIRYSHENPRLRWRRRRRAMVSSPESFSLSVIGERALLKGLRCLN